MSKQISCRVRPSEEEAMKAAADAKGMSLAEWMRSVLNSAAKRSAARARRSDSKR